ncbi:MAG: hypothetical protein D6E12_18215 [Desulfovibrio sp.]|nr:MAG: hypothetical protein D6E12_18215 [Desulfovibrio sp.]
MIGHTPLAVSDQCSEIRVFPDRRLNFSVLVSHQGKRFLRTGYSNPDLAQRGGVEVLIALHRKGAYTPLEQG